MLLLSRKRAHKLYMNALAIDYTWKSQYFTSLNSDYWKQNCSSTDSGGGGSAEDDDGGVGDEVMVVVAVEIYIFITFTF